MSDQCTASNKKVNMMLGRLSRDTQIVRSNENTLYNIYEATPRLRDSILVIELHKDQNALEKAQRRAAKHILTLCNSTNEEP